MPTRDTPRTLSLEIHSLRNAVATGLCHRIDGLPHVRSALRHRLINTSALRTSMDDAREMANYLLYRNGRKFILIRGLDCYPYSQGSADIC